MIQAGIALQILFGAFFLWRGYTGSVQSWSTFGGGAPKPPLYGIWVIDSMTIDGIERAPLVTDYERWRRVVIQTATNVTFWRMDDTPFVMPATVDLDGEDRDVHDGAGRSTQDRRHASASISRRRIGSCSTARSTAGRSGWRRTRSRARTSCLVNRGFNWIQEFPFNR